MNSGAVSTPAVRTEGIAKDYYGVPALQPLDLTVAAGERIALIGHNGSGKSTLLRMLAGMLEPTAGTASIAGHDLGSPDARAALAFVSDEPVFYDDLTVWEHLEYIARLHHTDDWESHAEHLVDVLGIGQRVDDLPSTFSRGLKQKAQLAASFVRPFEVLVVDEPFVGLDRAGRAALLELLAWAHDDGAAVVVATHELSSVDTADRLIALRDGTIVHDGDPAGADVAELTAGTPTGDDAGDGGGHDGDHVGDGGGDVGDGGGDAGDGASAGHVRDGERHDERDHERDEERAQEHDE
ncbi:MAG: ABC transporter ATP-binding protein [Actinomycetota bacterium]